MLPVIGDLKKSIDYFVEYTLTAIKGVSLPDFDEDHMDRMLRLDMARMALYIISSNGKVSWEETQDLAYYFGIDLSPADVNLLVREMNKYSDTGDQEPSRMLCMLVGVDNAIFNSSAANNTERWTSVLFYELLCELKNEIIRTSGQNDKNIIACVNIYLDHMKQYIDDNLEADLRIISGMKTRPDRPRVCS